MFKRNVEHRLLAALQDTPAIFLSGARQTGKSTLIKDLLDHRYPATYVNFDNAGPLSAAASDPEGYIRSIPKPVALDEVQRAPDLFLAIKAAIDRQRTPGLFILTGSANVLLLPRIADALVGRMEVITLWPLSQGEILGRKETFIDMVFSDDIRTDPPPAFHRSDLIESVVKGGYPEVLARPSADRRAAWFEAYITTILQRDIRDMARLEGLATLPRLLSLLAARAATLLNMSEIASSAGIPQTTLKRYLSLLETTFLITFLPAWSTNRSKRLIRTPKLLLCDTGLLVHLLGLNPAQLPDHPSALGQAMENFVAMELTKQIGWSGTQPRLYHFRTHRGQEVDLVLEDRRGRIVGIEVKAGVSVNAHDFKNLKALEEIAGENFHRGIVLYAGADIIPFGNNLFALPMNAIWEW